jgi:hypothetical protein
MTRTARLQSVETVKTLAAALRAYEEDATTAVADLDLQINRILEWVVHERKEYWGHRLRRDSERLSEARINLQRRRAVFGGDGLGQSCHDEQKAVDAAKRRVELAETKGQAVRRWRHVIERELLEFRATVNQLAGFLQVDMPRAKALLDRMSVALERYLAVEASAAAGPPPDWGTLLQDSSGATGQPASGEAAVAQPVAVQPVAVEPARPDHA